MGAGLPDWQELLTSLARRDEVCPALPCRALPHPALPYPCPPTHLPAVPCPHQVCLSEEEVAELQSLTMPDQAAVIAARLARTGGDALQGRLLQELVVAQMGAGEYSITHPDPNPNPDPDPNPNPPPTPNPTPNPNPTPTPTPNPNPNPNARR